MPTPESATQHLSHAFGIEVRASFDAPGLPTGSAGMALPVTQLDLADESVLECNWRPGSPERVLEEFFDGAAPDRTIDFDPELGYRLYARHFGLALINPKADRVLCAPDGEPDWGWQRFLVGRVLPWAALLQGREVFHASAVEIDGKAVAMVGATGHGKTSLAIQLVMRGAGFMTDDVLALEPGPGGVLAYPGANIAAIRPIEKERISSSAWARLGNELGTSGKTYVEIPRAPQPRPLDAIYFLRPADSANGIEPGVDPRELLASTFNSAINSPQRLYGLLEVCAEISSSVPTFRFPIDAETGSGSAADRLLRHHSETNGG